MAILLSASTLGVPDSFKLRNKTAAYWARHIIRLVGIRLGRAFSLYILSRYAAPFEFARGWKFNSSRVAPERAEEDKARGGTTPCAENPR